MQLNNEQIRRITQELFKQERHQELVYIVATEGCKTSEAERRTGVVQNTGSRYVKAYKEHIKYLEEINELSDQSN